MCRKTRTLCLILTACCFLLFSGCKKKGTEGATSEPNDVEQKVSQAVSESGDYLNKQKDVVLQKANSTYDQLKNDTQQLISKMKESGSKDWQTISADLNSKLTVVQQKLGDLKEAGSDAMQKAGDAFNKAVDDLKKTYQNAKSDFEKSQ